MESKEYHTYIVAYDLRTPGRNYQELYAALKSFESWGKITESVWAVISQNESAEIRDFLLKFMDANDRLLVVNTGDNAAWHNTLAKNEWVKENILK